MLLSTDGFYTEDVHEPVGPARARCSATYRLVLRPDADQQHAHVAQQEFALRGSRPEAGRDAVVMTADDVTQRYCVQYIINNSGATVKSDM